MAFTEVYLGLKTGTIDARQSLPTLKSAKLYEVTRQIVLTSHLWTCCSSRSPSRLGTPLPAQDKAEVKKAAARAGKFNDENRVREEKS